jgi:high-affinity iron transporter
MLQAFIIFLREGFEAFLGVAIILAYLRQTNQRRLVPAVYWAIAASLLASTALGYAMMQGVNEALWEATLGVVAMVMVSTLVIHMWRVGPKLKQKMEARLDEVTSRRSHWMAWCGVFLFTAFMITREGMETALMLLQVGDQPYLVGIILGVAAAAVMSWAWARFGRLINLRRFFQVTGIFLLLFIVQIGIYTFHEFSELGILPNSDAIHAATEIYSPTGAYGRWFSLIMIVVCAVWLAGVYLKDRLQRSRQKHLQAERYQAAVEPPPPILATSAAAEKSQ